MFDSNRPTAAEMRVMRADADRVREQLDAAAVAALDDTVLDLHGEDCTFCAAVLAGQMPAVAS